MKASPKHVTFQQIQPHQAPGYQHNLRLLTRWSKEGRYAKSEKRLGKFSPRLFDAAQVIAYHDKWYGDVFPANITAMRVAFGFKTPAKAKRKAKA